MSEKFKLDNIVEYFDDDEWVEATIIEIDLEDNHRPIRVELKSTGRTYWAREDQVRTKEIKISIIAKSNKICPICGREGMEGMVFFYCNNSTCLNYYDRYKNK